MSKDITFSSMLKLWFFNHSNSIAYTMSDLSKEFLFKPEMPCERILECK